jgi:hypothetical protein
VNCIKTVEIQQAKPVWKVHKLIVKEKFTVANYVCIRRKKRNRFVVFMLMPFAIVFFIIGWIMNVEGDE